MKLPALIALIAVVTSTLSLATGCGSAPGTPSAQAPRVVNVPPARPPPNTVDMGEPTVLAPRERRILGAIEAALPGARRVLVETSTPDEALLRSLRGAGVVVIDTRNTFDDASQHALNSDVVRLVLAGDRSDARARSGRHHHEVVTWTDGDAHLRYRGSGAHVVTPVDADDHPRRFEHIVIASGAPDDFRTRLVAADLWPEMPGLEVERINADGSRHVRLLGYVNAYYEHPEGQLSLAGPFSSPLQRLEQDGWRVRHWRQL